MLSWFKGCKKTEIQKLIVIDIGYNSHNLSKALLEIGNYQVVAYIDEEPWNHLNMMNGAKIHYPSELLSLVEKHGVDGVLQFEGIGWQPNEACLSSLLKLNAEYITLLTDHHIDEQIKRVITRLSFIG